MTIFASILVGQIILFADASVDSDRALLRGGESADNEEADIGRGAQLFLFTLAGIIFFFTFGCVLADVADGVEFRRKICAARGQVLDSAVQQHDTVFPSTKPNEITIVPPDEAMIELKHEKIPFDGVYCATYSNKAGKTFRPKEINFRFTREEREDGKCQFWKIEGDGVNVHGAFKITEGLISSSGQTYWAEFGAGPAVFSYGQYDFLHKTFRGKWENRSRQKGTYQQLSRKSCCDIFFNLPSSQQESDSPTEAGSCSDIVFDPAAIQEAESESVAEDCKTMLSILSELSK